MQAAQLRDLATSLFKAVDVPEADVLLIADLLVGTDLRGVFSHGTRLANEYARALRAGELNPRPAVQVAGAGPLALTPAVRRRWRTAALATARREARGTSRRGSADP